MATFYLTLNSVNLNRPGFCRINRSLIRLLGGPALSDVNQKVPYVDGHHAFDQLIDQTIYDLEAVVEGKVNQSGSPHADPIDGKVTNLVYLRDTIGTPANLTMPAVLHTSVEDISVDAQVANWMVARDEGYSAIVTFDLIVPRGAFDDGAS
jgi:hypothetical protein